MTSWMPTCNRPDSICCATNHFPLRRFKTQAGPACGTGFSHTCIVFLRLICYIHAMVVRMRSTRSHTGNRRSHHALVEKALAVCECGAVRVSHRACSVCGRYKGRIVVDHAGKAQAKVNRKAKRENAGRQGSAK